VPTLLLEYLTDLWKTRSTGSATDETAYYPALRDVFNAIGQTLKPKVFCQSQLKRSEAGHPDFGLFSQTQLRGTLDDEGPRLPPDRGVIEAKGTAEPIERIARSEQVTRYWEKYGLVLATNLRDFLLVGRDQFGRRTRLEFFSLASDETQFWEMARAGHAPKELAERFEQFLKRMLLHRATLTQPKDVAWFLASYARDALARIDAAGGPDTGSLETLRETMEEALGIKFEGEKGEHFFRSTLVQTLFYGLFSAWVLWCRKNEDPQVRKGFDSQGAAWHLRLPVLRAIFEEVNRPGALNPLRLGEVMEWAANTLCRVDDRAFFAQFKEEQAVQYFYEPFLEAFDPTLRKALGVWYTPHEVVEYMVERVDRVLRTELDIPDGLADSRVLILDPCCGTGSYLLEVLKRIERTLREKGDDALVARDVKAAAMERVFGFELMPAPFVVAHLQIGLLMDRLEVPFRTEIVHTRDKLERAAIYLTNALTGWGEREETHYLPIPELHEEMDRARLVKRERPILVVLGNPPYNAFAGVSPKDEGALVRLYKEGLVKKWGIKKFNLDDLYVRFFRIAERRITEQTGQGVVCYISNFSYLSDPSFVVMRERFLKEFDALWFDSLNGDSRETGKLTPDGKPDPSIFSTEQNREGIRVGTAIGLMVRTQPRRQQSETCYRELWGERKREELLESLSVEDQTAIYQQVNPSERNRHAFRPIGSSVEYESWPSLVEIASDRPFNGPIERRGNSLIVIPSDRADLVQRVTDYLDAHVSDGQLQSRHPALMRSSGEFDAVKTRRKLLGKVAVKPECVVKYQFKPFDWRVAYIDPKIAPLFSRPNPELVECASISKNSYFITREVPSKTPEGFPTTYSRSLSDYDVISGHARHFPVFVQEHREGDLIREQSHRVNLSQAGRSYLNELSVDQADVLWLHALAVTYSVEYCTSNEQGLRVSWPRIPLPASKERLLASAELGKQVAALLDPDTPVRGVTTGVIRPELKVIGTLRRSSGGGLDDDDLKVTAGWGHAGQNGVTMPGRGRRDERPYSQDELNALEAGAAALGMDVAQVRACLGEGTSDVWLNDKAYWANVPERVWEFTIGGYQVMKKWLSYREYDLLGRPLKPEEAREVTAMARHLAALCLLQPKLDEDYRAVVANLYPWPRPAAGK
jgi:hypothetical protein